MLCRVTVMVVRIAIAIESRFAKGKISAAIAFLLPDNQLLMPSYRV